MSRRLDRAELCGRGQAFGRRRGGLGGRARAVRPAGARAAGCRPARSARPIPAGAARPRPSRSGSYAHCTSPAVAHGATGTAVAAPAPAVLPARAAQVAPLSTMNLEARNSGLTNSKAILARLIASSSSGRRRSPARDSSSAHTSSCPLRATGANIAGSGAATPDRRGRSSANTSPFAALQRRSFRPSLPWPLAAFWRRAAGRARARPPLEERTAHYGMGPAITRRVTLPLTYKT